MLGRTRAVVRVIDRATALARIEADLAAAGSPPCLMCALVDGRLETGPALAGSELVRTVLTRYPVRWGHALVVVAPHVTDFFGGRRGHLVGSECSGTKGSHRIDGRSFTCTLLRCIAWSGSARSGTDLCASTFTRRTRLRRSERPAGSADLAGGRVRSRIRRVARVGWGAEAGVARPIEAGSPAPLRTAAGVRPVVLAEPLTMEFSARLTFTTTPALSEL